MGGLRQPPAVARLSRSAALLHDTTCALPQGTGHKLPLTSVSRRCSGFLPPTLFPHLSISLPPLSPCPSSGSVRGKEVTLAGLALERSQCEREWVTSETELVNTSQSPSEGVSQQGEHTCVPQWERQQTTQTLLPWGISGTQQRV